MVAMAMMIASTRYRQKVRSTGRTDRQTRVSSQRSTSLGKGHRVHLTYKIIGLSELRQLLITQMAVQCRNIRKCTGTCRMRMTRSLGGHRVVVIFHEISAVDPLKRVASGTNRLASKFASQALHIIGESVPFTLSSQVPLWTATDVKHWLQQSGFGDYTSSFTESHVDGDMLLLLTEENLQTDLKMTNGIIRKRFLRELTGLKIKTDYSSCDPTQLNEWLSDTSSELTQYTYQMLKAGADRRILRFLSDDNLNQDCNVQNGVHRMKIMEAAKMMPKSAVIITGFPAVTTPIGYEQGDGTIEKPIDCFISYRRSNGSQLASLLKVHLQLRGFTVFLDIEKLRAGKFDDNLLNSVRNARHFILVLTPCCLDRCMGDTDMKDWVHREVVAAIEGGCNIIPVLDSFQWPTPETLPEDMRSICFFNGISWVHDYQEACVAKVEEFMRHGMKSQPSQSNDESSSV